MDGSMLFVGLSIPMVGFLACFENIGPKTVGYFVLINQPMVDVIWGEEVQMEKDYPK